MQTQTGATLLLKNLGPGKWFFGFFNGAEKKLATKSSFGFNSKISAMNLIYVFDTCIRITATRANQSKTKLAISEFALCSCYLTLRYCENDSYT